MRLLEKDHHNPDLDREALQDVHDEVAAHYPDSDREVVPTLTSVGRNMSAIAREDEDFSDLPDEARETFEQVLEHKDDAEFQADTLIDVVPNLPQDFVYAHELGHEYFDEFVKSDLDSSSKLVTYSLSEMFAEATAYHFTDHDPQDEVLNRDPFEDFSGFTQLRLTRMSDPYEAMKDEKYGGPIDVPHNVGCRMGARLVENNEDPRDMIRNIGDYEEAMEHVIRETLEYAQEERDPQVENLDPVYDQALQEV